MTEPTDNKQSVLTDDFLKLTWDSINTSYGREPFRCSHHDFARAVEQAVLSKLREASEPSDDRLLFTMRNLEPHLKDADAAIPVLLSTARALLARYGAPRVEARASEPIMNLTVSGRSHEIEPTTAAFSIPDGEYQLYANPVTPQSSAEARMLVADGWLDDHITANVKFTRGEMPGVYYCQGWRDAETHYKLAAPAAADSAKGAGDVDERAAFEAAFTKETGIQLCADGTFSSDRDAGLYEIAKWAWQARAALAAAKPTINPIIIDALRAAQNNLGAIRPVGSSDPHSPDYDQDAFEWDYYQKALDAAIAQQGKERA